MFTFPPIPAWNAAHPIVVHLPLGVLAVVPMLVLMTMCARRMRQPMAFMTLVVLLFGSAGTVFAVMSGGATEHVVLIPGLARNVMEKHEEYGELSRNVFLTLSAVYLIIFGSVVVLGEKFKRSAWVVSHLLFVGALGAGLLLLANTGHLGGRLVHEFGVRAPIAGLESVPLPAIDEFGGAPEAAEERKPK